MEVGSVGIRDEGIHDLMLLHRALFRWISIHLVPQWIDMCLIFCMPMFLAYFLLG